jgi:hypothetical protein
LRVPPETPWPGVPLGRTDCSPAAAAFTEGFAAALELDAGVPFDPLEEPQAARTTAALAVRATPRATFLEMSMLILSGLCWSRPGVGAVMARS